MLEAYQQVHVNECLYALLCISVFVCLVCLRLCWEVCFSASICNVLSRVATRYDPLEPTTMHCDVTLSLFLYG